MKLLTMLIAISQAQSNKWIVSSIATVDATVDNINDLKWALQSNQPMMPQDCIQVSITNPYTEPFQFFANTGPVSCDQQCAILSSTMFQITLNTSSPTTLIQGRSYGNIFRNPYSTKRISQVQITHLQQCKTPVVSGQSSFPQFIPQLLNQTSIKSSSQVIGQTGVNYTVQFNTTSDLRRQGKIIIASPHWYQSQAIGQEGVTQDFYSDSLISFESNAFIASKLTVTNIVFTSKNLIISYNASQIYTSGTSVTIIITNCQNPVDQKQVSGFQVTTTDADGFLIDQSASLVLQTIINKAVPLNYVQISLLGDQNGQNVGMIGTLQQLQIQLSTIQPLEPFCYFQFKFPSCLQLTSVQYIEGTGIFQPYQDTNVLNTGQYQVDLQNNILNVEACRLSDYLSKNPYGSIQLSYLQMPPYVQDIPPIQVLVYTDQVLTNLIINDPTSAKITAQSLKPGLMTAELFKPSNFYASAANVAYSIYVRPQHELTPQSRIIITMPDLLKFNRTLGCQVVLTVCNCSIDSKLNILTLTNILQTNLAGGNLIKFVILQAQNPKGSRQAGPWSIRSETPVNGTFYVVDGQTYPESFFALSGAIYSSLLISNLTVSSNRTVYNFTINFEHDIPQGGSLILTFPPETIIINNRVQGISNYTVVGNTYTFNITQTADTPLSFQIFGVQNVRSMQPSSSFQLATTDANGYVIDSGGQDMVIEPTSFAYFNKVTIANLNQTNGGVGALNVSISSAYPFWSGDVLHLDLPQEMHFVAPVICIANFTIQCSYSGQSLQVTLISMQNQTTLFLTIQGIQNPPSFQSTSPLNTFYTTDQLGYKSQSIRDSITFTTSSMALIQQYQLTQQTEDYNKEGWIQLQFMTVNPIQPTGAIVLQWPSTVSMFSNTFCQITTYKQILLNVCKFDFASQRLTIQNAFVGMQSSYSGQITIYLSRVLNPVSNQQKVQYQVTTYQDSQLLYPTDTFTFLPLLKCFWSCQLCSTDKNYCTQCWPSMNYLFQFQQQSTCLTQCPMGWTSNGTVPAVCQQCDVSCGSCQDSGQAGDVGRCLTCKPGYNLFQPTSAVAGLCLIRCNQGFYDNNHGLCLPCASNCQSCFGTANNCTSCNQDSAVPALYDSQCIGECPISTIDLGGVCQKCTSPCSQCEGTQSQCTACDGSEGRMFSFGADCVSSCPQGTKLNVTSNQCTGCISGCAICDLENPSICYSCSPGYLNYNNGCFANCPAGTLLNFAGTSCRAMSSLDVRLIYFPFIILTILVAFVSWIGHKIKPTHLVFANFSIMLGAIEHVAMIVQVALSFIQGTYAVAIPIVIIYVLFVVTLLGFGYFWRRDVIRQDGRYQQYSQNELNKRSTIIRTVLGTTISWKFYKLLYSHFFGVKITSFRFSDPLKVEKLMLRTTLVSIIITYVPLIVLNSIGLVYLTWGTQLYIMMLENLLLAILGVLVGIFEHKQMVKDRKGMDQVQQKAGGLSKQIRKDRLKLNTFMTELTVNKDRFSFLFMDSKIEQLVNEFGCRRCKSDFHDSQNQQQDERRTISWPMTPNRVVFVEDPPQPLPGYMNCYNEPKPACELKPLNGQGFNKACQKGGPFDNDLKRADTAFMSDQCIDDGSPLKSSRKQRGRRNRFQKQIEAEDHKNTGLPHEYLDSVSEESVKQVEDQETKDGSLKKLQDTIVTQQSQASVKKEVKTTSVHSPQKKVKIEPPNIRNFNEIDILGEFDRDVNGFVIVLQDTIGNYIDKKGRLVTQQGYLIDSEGDIVSAHDQAQKMFKGVLPAPFQLEKFNFNPYEMIGNFKSYRQNTDPCSFNKTSDKNGSMDSKNRYVNQQGFLIKNGNLINQKGKSVFDSKQLEKGKLPKLFNYEGQQFSILDVMGVHKLNDFNEVVLGKKDLSGHLVNSKGYLVNNYGDIVTRKKKVIFKSKDLKFGEFPKIFAFSRLNIKDIQGTFETENGLPVLTRKQDGSFSDDNGIKVNSKGYLVDTIGNIVDHNGNIVIEAHILDNGNLPNLFKHVFQVPQDDMITEKSVFRRHSRRDSSYGSEMGASPTKYDQQNGHKEGKPELRASTVVKQSRLSQSSSMERLHKKKKGIKFVKVEQMFQADVQMAKAYGGEAVPRVRMVPKRFQTTHRERPFQETMRDSQYSQQMPQSIRLKPKMFQNEYATTSNNGFKRSQLEAAGATQLNLRPSSPSNQAFSIKNQMQNRKQNRFQEDLDVELAELYRQDVDKFIDGSNFEVESLSGFSDLSGGSIVSKHQQEQIKAKQMETEYLQKLEQQKLQFQQQAMSKRPQ